MIRNRIVAPVAALLLAATAGAQDVQYGPPASPLSWDGITLGADTPKPFVPPPNILGDSIQPVSVELVEMNDQHPWGEAPRRAVWLARYEAVPLHCGSIATASVALSLAYDATTKNLLCAFTDPAPRWARSTAEPLDIASYYRWKLSPARYEGLRSTVMDVLNRIWELHNKDPRRVGQIIVRPRHNDNDLGTLTIPEAPSNVWVVAVPGEVVWRGRDYARTTWVMVYRDSDLKELFGTIAP